jgi:putative restriction endonuclease
MDPSPLALCLDRFARLHRNRTAAKGAAPHKPLLLLAILHEVAAGRVAHNRVALTPELVATFQTLWKTLVPPNSGWKPRITYPLRYLQQDGFWELVRDGRPVAIQTAHEPTLHQLAGLCDGGRFPDDLWALLADPVARAALEKQLLDTYFDGRSAGTVEDAATDYLAHQAQVLRAQAQATFRIKKVVETTEEYFVRHRLFPQVVKDQYGHACCVCRLSARLGNSGILDAAHILPFAKFHNDDPRNGLALCKNHHWGFDAGAWSLTDDYTVLVAPGLRQERTFVEAGVPIAMPRDETCLPVHNALQWHREHIFQRPLPDGI